MESGTLRDSQKHNKTSLNNSNLNKIYIYIHVYKPLPGELIQEFIPASSALIWVRLYSISLRSLSRNIRRSSVPLMDIWNVSISRGRTSNIFPDFSTMFHGFIYQYDIVKYGMNVFAQFYWKPLIYNQFYIYLWGVLGLFAVGLSTIKTPRRE